MLHGFDLPFGEWDERFPSRMLENGERVARESGQMLLPVATNLHLVTRPLTRWSLSHGSALLSVALAFQEFFGRVLIGAGTTYDQLYPWGSHPVLDPRWSTEQMTVVHDGCEMNRIDKIAFIAGSDVVLDTLKVCQHYNCGTCLKCLPTIIDLMQIGALEKCSLADEVDVERLREMFRAYKGELNVENYQRRLASLEESEGDPHLRAALVEFLEDEAASTSAASSRTLLPGKGSLFGRIFPRSSR